MALPRESTFLPTIKCSVCGNQVEISRMGDHLCSGPTAELSPPLDVNDGFENQLTKPSYPKYGRTPPPLETGSMGQTYMHRGQLTPVSQPSESRNASPVYPVGSASPRRTAQPFSSRQAIDDSWETPTSATLSNRPGGYGGFDEPEREISDKPSGGGFLERMNSTVGGPFDPVRRPSTAKDSYPQRKDSLEKWTPPDEPVPPRQPRKDGYEGFGAPKSLEPNGPGMLSRSETYPKPAPPMGHSQTQRTPSAPGSRPDLSRMGGGYGHERKKSMGPDKSRKPPPRISLLPQHKIRNTGSVDLAAEFGIGNPYHTSSESASSGYSEFSVDSRTTAQTSPARSQTYQTERSRGMNDVTSSTEILKPKDLRIDASAASSHRFAPRMVDSPLGISPRDDQFDRTSPNSQRGPPSRGGYSSSPQQYGDYMRADRRNEYGRDDPASPRWQNTWERKGSRDPIPPPSRGDCKACGIAITGKSISSADGRLTGKYHKACFVCTTCSEPFSSSVFYVLNDKPYCAQHYHKLNGSLCGSCGRGIEGQYVEDEARVKYHVGCFRCLDCDVSLSDGYFEVDGHSYCERDAWKRVQSYAQPEPEAYQPRPPRGAVGARVPNGLPARPGPRPGQGGRPNPPPKNGLPNGGRLAPGVDQQRLRMNKRMTRLGNMNL